MMSAGPKAKPLAEENKEWLKCDWSFICEYGCGYSGLAHELLAEEDEDTLYCPQCGTAGWIWD
jgi:hypothetical protein